MSKTGSELRKQFLSFFEQNGHHVARSSPLVPQGDATLLFTNAGMVQFKDVFTGRETRPYKRATSSQKCVRAGGKHNDLENVGRTARHHTFFEMLGNFSFGDYFKEAAIEYAWGFLTKELGMDAKRLSVTVFAGDDQTPPDEEAEGLWRKIAGAALPITRCGADDNFWQMGDTGPCGPCTEIHYDRGDVKGTFGGDDPEGDRIMEVWNVVFMQYERQADRSLRPLPAPSVDTGMGLERLAMIMGGFASNYDTDLLRPLVAFSEEKLGKKYGSTDGGDDVAMRVIADHARTTAFLVGDGVLPGNVNREYVLRSIMRRAVRFGDRLGFNDLFFHDVVDRAVELFTPAYPELASARALLSKVVVNEEEAFRRTLQKGTERVGQLLSGGAVNFPESFTAPGVVSGAIVFDLKATYGFPPDLTALMLRESGLTWDEESFKLAEETHTKASSTDSFQQDGSADIYKTLRAQLGPTVFTGYDSHTTGGVKVLAIVKDGASIQQLAHGEQGFVILDRTPFYGESGGQVGDMGHLKGGGDLELRVDVDDTKKQADLHLHAVAVKTGTLKVGAVVDAVVDNDQLDRVRKNHSATHLLHSALRMVLGEHVVQKGSLVDANRLRFDFAHFEAMTRAQIEQVEDIVNDMVLENVAADVEHMHFEAAKEKGAMALFGEKYGDHVRVVAFPTLTRTASVELCGGIHVRRTGDIGLIKITSEGPLAAGVRRLEAVTGKGALEWVRKQSTVLTEVARNLKASVDDVPARIEKMNESLKAAYAEIQTYKNKAQTASASSASSSAIEIKGVKLLAIKADGIDPKGLREYADKLRDQVGSGVVVVGVADGDKVTLLVALTADLAKAGKLHAGKMIGELAVVVGGKGGGKPDLAQAGGTKPEMLDEALSKAKSLVEAALA
ncbi:MAG: alanine--tRNA ligase [Deltaproteobacteria bacterium]|nr:alanine--tRNA ligase [Deltaproteobacteria bacterium]